MLIGVKSTQETHPSNTGYHKIPLQYQIRSLSHETPQGSIHLSADDSQKGILLAQSAVYLQALARIMQSIRSRSAFHSLTQRTTKSVMSIKSLIKGDRIRYFA